MKTVADIVAELLKLPQDLPVLVGCHYDNDDGLTNEVRVRQTNVAPSDGPYHIEVEPSWGYAGTFPAVTIA